MRLVSLLPAATEWVAALGAAGALVGRSHACDFPPAVRSLPVLTRSSITDGDSAAIDREVREKLQAGLSLYDVDLDALRALRPDLILTQTQCGVCAISVGALEAVLAEWAGTRPEVLSFEAATFRGVLDEVLALGRRLGRMPQAMAVIGRGERRLRALRERIGVRRDGTVSGRPAPTVACVEWMEPLMTAGHWVPDLVKLAGGRAVCAEAGAPSRYVGFEEIAAADPDVIVVAACGFSTEHARADLHHLTERPGWGELRAVQAGRAFLFDGNAYFNRPGPRLYRSAELLAAALHPERAGIEPEPWEMQPFTAEVSA